MGGNSIGMLQVVLLLAVISGCRSVELEIMPYSAVQAKPIGKKVLLTCRAQDDKGLISNLQWLDPQNRTIRNDNELTRDRLSVEKMTPDTLALIFTSLKESEAGTYTCSAVYASTQTISKSVRIDTIYAITWIDAPEEQFPILGSRYKVKCKVQANPSPIVDWLRNGQQIMSGASEHYVIDTDGLVIQNVTEEDDGIYICRAIVLDTGELNERNIKVEVHTAPKFDERMPTSVEVVEGESASVTCVAKGKPRPQYSWIRSNNDLNLASSDRSTVNENTGVLTITRVSKEDNGEIKCMARNAAGTMEKSVNLVVIIKPQVMDIRNISVAEKRESKLVCRATGNPLPKVTFWKIGSNSEMVAGLQPADDRVVVDQRVIDGTAVATLIISPLMKSDDGLYTCIARNKGGEARKNGHLTVEFPPSFANTPIKEAWSWNKNPVNLTCLAESIPNATILWRLNERDIERDPNFKKYGEGPISSLLVTPIDNRFYGTYKCTAKNVHGEVFHTISLSEAHIPSEVLQALMDVVTATTITFSFKGPSSTGGRPLKAYQVEYKDHMAPWKEARNKTWAINSPYILEGLMPQTTYNFRFAAVNDVGSSNWAAQQTVTMPKRSYPEEPKILNPTLAEEKYAVSPYHDRFELSWRIPPDNGEPIDRYDIKYCPVQKVNNEWVETDASCTTLEHRSLEVTSYELQYLHPDTFYKVEIRAHNVIGFSVPGQIVIKTARGATCNTPGWHTSPPDGSTGGDPNPFKHDPSHLSSSIIIGIVVAALLVILIIVDISCFFVNDTGLLHLMCGKDKRNSNDDDAKLGSLYSWRFPLPYCSNASATSSNQSEHLGSEVEKILLPTDVNFVFEGKELLNNGHRDLKVQIEAAPMLDKNKKETTVEFDLKKATSKTSFVGKDSAV